MTKDDVYKKLGVELEFPIEVIEKVVSWSYMKANHAVREHKEIEVTGLGNFFISPAKARRRIKNIERILQLPITIDVRKESLNQELQFIKNQLGEQIQGVSSTPPEST